MTGLIAARAQFGISLGFHIVFAALGVGLPLYMCVAEGIALRKRDKEWYILARRWSKAFAILYAIGAVSGTVISFELGLLWPRFMGFAGGVIGLPFAIEAFAFFTEGIFLGLYLYGWSKLSPVAHWLCAIPLAAAGLVSALIVVTANGWMNTPSGFRVVDGRPVDVDPVAAVFNASAIPETVHMALAAYEATGFAVAAVYGFALLRGRRDPYLMRGMTLGMILGSIVAPLQILAGDWNARMVAETQPAKLAAMEALFQTTKGAPETIYGIPDTAAGQTYLAIHIPKLLSFLITGDPNGTVTGLESFPVDLRPPVAVVHYAFDTMVGIGFLAVAVVILYWALYFRARRQVPTEGRLARLALWGAVALGPLTFLAIELGWMTTEFGRQPWIIQGYMLTRDAVTPAPGLGVTFAAFILTYLLLSAATIILLRRVAGERRGTPPRTLPGGAGDAEADAPRGRAGVA
jgi:cytochrome bd ubiquinol oxidase subunit I